MESMRVYQSLTVLRAGEFLLHIVQKANLGCYPSTFATRTMCVGRVKLLLKIVGSKARELLL